MLLITAINFTSSLSLQLYTAKLYKGRHEFLQLVPKREGGKAKADPLKTFPLKGVNIKVTEKKMQRICSTWYLSVRWEGLPQRGWFGIAKPDYYDKI